MKANEIYKQPTLEIVTLSVNDVITTSGFSGEEIEFADSLLPEDSPERK